MNAIETVTKLATDSITMAYRLDNIDSRIEMFDSCLRTRIAFHVNNGEANEVELLESVRKLFNETCVGVK